MLDPGYFREGGPFFYEFAVKHGLQDADTVCDGSKDDCSNGNLFRITWARMWRIRGVRVKLLARDRPPFKTPEQVPVTPVTVPARGRNSRTQPVHLTVVCSPLCDDSRVI